MTSEIYIIGAGGLGCEIAAALLNTELKSKFRLIGFIDDNLKTDTLINDIPVIGNIDWLSRQQNVNAIIALGNPALRKKIADKLSNARIDFATIIHPGASLHGSNHIKIGKGTYIADGCILTTNISIAEHNLILSGARLSHDTIIADFCTLMPGILISSGATIASNVFIGTGTIIAKQQQIDSSTIIPAGSVLI
jgi:sugar O-acyltransferase (sialic acid O-acetyltransferase NeuD family)